MSTSMRSVVMVEPVYILWLLFLEAVLLRRALKYSQALSTFLSIAESILRFFRLFVYKRLFSGQFVPIHNTIVYNAVTGAVSHFLV